MRLQWLYDTFFTLGEWVDMVFSFLTQSVGQAVEENMVSFGLQFPVPDILYSFSIWQLMFGLGFGIWLFVTLVTWILDIVT